MRLKKLKISNFRCFGPEETCIYFKNLTAFIGANSAGKTSLLQALLKLFGPYSRQRDLKRSDFHVPADKKPEELESNNLYIEAVIDFPELSSEEESAKQTIPPFFERMAIDGQGEEPYIRIRLEASWEKGSSPEGDIDPRLIFITSSETEDEILDEDKTTVSAHHRSNIQMIYVPAIREPYSQLKNASGTILWRILNGINWSDNIEERIKEKISEVDTIFDSQEGIKLIRDIIKSEWKSFHKDTRYTEAQLKFNSSDLETMLKKIDVEFSPTEVTRAYNIDCLGEGLRSLFYLSLVNSLLNIESIAQKKSTTNPEENIFTFTPPVLTILAVEEPENHISPQLLGKIVANLKKISQKSNAQVLITSHTPAIIKRIDPESICHLRICKHQLRTISNRILLPSRQDEAFKYVKEAVTAYPEIYFARLVILGEGDTEEIVIPKAISSMGYTIDASGICVVPLGGRYVNHFWKLLNGLEIPFLTLLDLDLERNGGGWGRVKYAIKQLLDIGVLKEKLLKLSDGSILSDEDLEKMHTWSENKDEIEEWINELEEFGVFFSRPLDLDFAMLLAFEDTYKRIAPESGGPRVSNDKNSDDFKDRLEKDIHATLKSEGGQGDTYTEKEKELMIWYVYLFLNRSKPSTHILALSKIDESIFKENLPLFLKELIKKTNQLLKDDPYSEMQSTVNQL